MRPADTEFTKLKDNIKYLIPNSNISILADEDVNDGYIFNYNHNNHAANKYDILLIGHQEYVTQEEYNNLKQFVYNGGTLIILSGNVFYAEVKYDKINHSVRLVNGHGFSFDGHTASRGFIERWENETRNWVGSNSYRFGTSTNNIFKNNPFNYTTFEDSYITNPHDKIIMNYGLMNKGYVIATYVLDYGNGKVISTGISGVRLLHNTAFLVFFEKMITNNAIPNYLKNNTHISNYQ